MNTIGVTRGFGDHDLRAISSKIPIKPFLSSRPEVRFVIYHNVHCTVQMNTYLMLNVTGELPGCHDTGQTRRRSAHSSH